MKNTPVVINSLPPEVFECIFSLSMPDCIQYEPRPCLSTSYGFVGVCRYWRQIATRTPGLWGAHIDVSNLTPNSLLRLLLERAKNSPINIHLLKLDSGRGMPRFKLSEAILLLEPHMNRVRSLETILGTFSYDSSFSLVNQWLDYGDPALANALSLRASNLAGKDVLNQMRQSENSKKLLSSISSLRLGGFVFPWDSGIYRNLTSLILFNAFHVTTSELHRILAASS
ncbi:hypothetical protein FRC12_011662 [Ceratobasidium sp. 428]|nr:hypothetical protein FRC12_011662 [Ceratobasidium sp. 428]